MDRPEILARNLLILKQLEKLFIELKKNNISVILLKGVALITLVPEYAKTRIMEDIDILIKPRDLYKIENIIYALGYKNALYDPWAYFNEDKIAYLDLCTELWYLDKKESVRVWFDTVSIKTENEITYLTLSIEDLYINIFSHWKIHHTEFDNRCNDDLNLLDLKFGSSLKYELIQTRLSEYFGRKIKIENLKNISKESQPESIKIAGLKNYRIIGLSGHIKRFIFLRFKQKLNYFFKSMFPSFSFVKKRYSIKNNFYLPFVYIVRPLFLMSKLFRICG